MNKEEFATYIESVALSRKAEALKKQRNETVEFKYKKLNALKETAKNDYAKHILFNIYESALPLSDDYKNAYSVELKDFFNTYIENNMGDICEFIKGNKNAFAKNLLESVEDLVEEQWLSIGRQINKITSDDIKFEGVDSEEIIADLDIKKRDLNGDEISDIIKNNVKNTAIKEITKAKEEKEKLKEFERELMQDINIDSEEKIEEAVKNKFRNKKRYNQSLFESVMVNKFNKQAKAIEEGTFIESATYESMNIYGKTEASVEDNAFIEAIKEYTALSLFDATRINMITKNNINDFKYNYTK